MARGWKNVHQKTQTKRSLEWGPSAIHPLYPGEQNPSGSPEFIAVSPFVRLTEKKKMKN
jgi:hypothetical protein